MENPKIALKFLVTASDQNGATQSLNSLADLGQALSLSEDDLNAIRASGEALDAVLKDRTGGRPSPPYPRVQHGLQNFFGDVPAGAAPEPGQQGGPAGQ